jgi:parallel beta-helix repeat protein
VGDGELGDVEIRASGETDAVTFNAKQGRITKLSIRNLGDAEALSIYEGSPVVEDCDISGYGIGIFIAGKSTNAHLYHCRIHDMATSGVWVTRNSRALIVDCDIVDNGGPGIIIAKGGAPTVRKCRINRNSVAMLIDAGGRGGSYEDNDLRDNKDGAWHRDWLDLMLIKRQGNIE